MSNGLESGIQIISTSMKTGQEKLSTISRNITQSNDPNYARREAVVKPMIAGSCFQGIRIKDIKTNINPELVIQINKAFAEIMSIDVQNDTWNKLEALSGSVGQQSTLGHQLNSWSNTLEAINTNPEIAKSNAIQELDNTIQKIKGWQQGIISNRRELDIDCTNSVTIINGILQQIAENNKDIKEAKSRNDSLVDFEETRRRLLSELDEYVSVCTYKILDSKTGFDTGAIGVVIESGETLVVDDLIMPLSYTPTDVIDPSAAFNPILVNGATLISPGGKINGINQAANTILPNIQAVLDNLSNMLVRTINHWHNLGTSINAPNQMTGLIGVLDDATPLNAATTIVSGDGGTLRLGVLDNDGLLVQHSDIVVNANQGLNGLLTTLSTNTGITAIVTADGRLQLTANNANHHIAIGGDLQFTTGATLGANPVNFSEFFGLNDLVQNNLHTTLPNTPGLANDLAVNPALLADSQRFAIGKLNMAIPVSTPAISSRDTSVVQGIQQALKMPTIAMPAAGPLPARNTSLIDYANGITNYITTSSQNTKSIQKTVLQTQQNLAEQFSQQSGVNVKTEMMKLMNEATEAQILQHALMILFAVRKELLNL